MARLKLVIFTACRMGCRLVARVVVRKKLSVRVRIGRRARIVVILIEKRISRLPVEQVARELVHW